MIKAKDWSGEDLKGVWLSTYKLDGVRVIVKDGVATSRSGKPLYNIPWKLIDGDYECYVDDDFKSTISAVRSHAPIMIDVGDFYRLDPIAYRLIESVLKDPTAIEIRTILKRVVDFGYEGLVLRQGDTWLKVKPHVTYDLKVVGYQEGKGKHTGRMGALITEMGKVGTGFTDEDRERFTEDYIIGKVIELRGMQVTEAGKLRHPRFIRERLDK